MPAQSAIPQLPVELLERIISTAWHIPLSSNERIAFMLSSMLVNSTWADTFDLVSSRDVYIVSSTFYENFIQRMRSQAPAVTNPPPSFLRSLFRSAKPAPKPSIQRRPTNTSCQSITIQITNIAFHPDKDNRPRLPIGAVLDELLETIDVHSLAPNLRRLAIEYVDAGFNDIFHRTSLAALPPQITDLELRYTFGVSMPLWLVEVLREQRERQRHIRYLLPSITHLSVTGAGKSTVGDLLRLCPHVESFHGEAYKV